MSSTEGALNLTFLLADGKNESATTESPLSSVTTNSNVTTYIIAPIASITLLFLLSGLVMFLIRKKRLDKLRHHLMPLYNFDPAEEGEDWESELLEEGTNYKIAVNGKMRVETPSPTLEPKLSFNRL